MPLGTVRELYVHFFVELSALCLFFHFHLLGYFWKTTDQSSNAIRFTQFYLEFKKFDEQKRGRMFERIIFEKFKKNR